MEEPGRLIAVVLLASFAIERVVAAVDFFMSDGALFSPEKRRKLVRVGVSALIGLGIVAFTGIRLLGAMKFHSASSWIDFVLTCLVLVGGADKLDQFIGASGGGKAPAKKEEIRPIQIFIDKDDVTEQALRIAR
jgi:hypothetical protein